VATTGAFAFALLAFELPFDPFDAELDSLEAVIECGGASELIDQRCSRSLAHGRKATPIALARRAPEASTWTAAGYAVMGTVRVWLRIPCLQCLRRAV
jgi:hypothetical protein